MTDEGSGPRLRIEVRLFRAAATADPARTDPEAAYRALVQRWRPYFWVAIAILLVFHALGLARITRGFWIFYFSAILLQRALLWMDFRKPREAARTNR